MRWVDVCSLAVAVVAVVVAQPVADALVAAVAEAQLVADVLFVAAAVEAQLVVDALAGFDAAAFAVVQWPP